MPQTTVLLDRPKHIAADAQSAPTNRLEIDHTLGKIAAIKHGSATTYTLEWGGHYLGETVQGADKLFYVGTGQGYTLPEAAHYLLIQFLDKIRLSNEWAYNQLIRQESPATDTEIEQFCR